MFTTLFVDIAVVDAETQARRERLTRDWPRQQRGEARSRRPHFGLHLPVRTRRVA
ncbi:MAG TPA: hypothetical protein VE781_07540 [Kineosporiaceae bacterium]|jgi:hypothetical protein|nr:hypothetical protein [Kineosporiaceae bacterium]